MADTYDPPRIESRTEMADPLIGAINSANVDGSPSAAFRSV
jgi:hypothetical protein